MATVINVASISPLLVQLGWADKVNIAEALDEMRKNAVPATAVHAYLQALAASPESLDDQSIAGCDPAIATKITAWLTRKGAVSV